MASVASCWVALWMVPSTCLWLCGWTTSIFSPPPGRCSPPMVTVRSIGSAWPSRLSAPSSSARSALPGAYVSTGSFFGAGVWVTASTAAPLLRLHGWMPRTVTADTS